MKVLALLASGFEDLEAFGTIALLRRAKIEVTLCSVENKYQVTGKYGLNVNVDIKIKDINKPDYDVLFLPGGMPGVDHLLLEEKVLELVEFFMKENKIVAAICAAPSILGRLGLLKAKSFTCFPGFESFGVDGCYENVPVKVDGNLITGRAAGSVIEFSAAIIAKVSSEETSKDVLEQICF
ncbi:MAG: hypothetical protein K0Q49_1629 [Haloplasmataceae bacterium]|jgi:4-methyl-5(b-hydroxyethyl)-thiazole monophosphate biosynthesis|nr:hypothetical protein [Haloplasmataceae bacterium]